MQIFRELFLQSRVLLCDYGQSQDHAGIIIYAGAEAIHNHDCVAVAKKFPKFAYVPQDANGLSGEFVSELANEQRQMSEVTTKNRHTQIYADILVIVE